MDAQILNIAPGQNTRQEQECPGATVAVEPGKVTAFLDLRH